MKYKKVRVGDYYEDCSYHPCLCVSVVKRIVNRREVDTDIEGIDLVTGHTPSHSQMHCGLRVLTLKQALKLKYCGPDPKDVTISPDKQWWDNETVKYYKEIEQQHISKNKPIWREYIEDETDPTR